ncbi:MAG: hypothetical protein C0464_01260 [Cyanobacteria bacterium DS2.008]|uniref:glycosyl hydrolase family 28-related protein n=1 Tax=Blastomonas sp. TaxID=1909299 RepID=UPI0018388711|nr:hypothetical protein [Cyanobacteria bacterium DS2.008]MBA4781358.1 hypothetical protein [Blastomonas sp.]
MALVKDGVTRRAAVAGLVGASVVPPIGAAQESADVAQDAADLASITALTAGNVYASTADGLGGTPDGDYFWTPNPLRLWKNAGGAAEEQDILATRAGLLSNNGADLINFLQEGADAVKRSLRNVLYDRVSVKDFGAKGDGVTIDTDAIQKAVNTGKSIFWPLGVYLSDEVEVPIAARGAIYEGAGYYHYSKDRQTVIRAANDDQASIFKLASGADCMTFARMRIDGDRKAKKVIDGTFGAFLTIDHCGIYNGVEYGVYSRQGLARIHKAFMAGSRVNCHVWSDSCISDSEFTQTEALTTEICLRLAAGGNRLSNVWCNSGTVCCLELSPFDNATNHINTDIVNLYIGEVFSGAVVRPIIRIAGTAANRVQQVRITNAFIVCAQGDVDHVNDGIVLDYALDIELCNINFRGFGLLATSTQWMRNAIRSTNTENLNIVGGTIRDVNKNPILLATGTANVSITGVTFINWAEGGLAAGDDFAAILSSIGPVNCTGCEFTVLSDSTNQYSARIANAEDMQFTGALINYANSNIVIASSGTPAWHYKRNGSAFGWVQNHVLTQSGIDDSLVMYNAKPASAVPNSAVFLNAATGKLSFKDGSGTVHDLY